ncbi:hypothetical protein BDF14DRAFT_1784077 [Spinellus fusiger]|nr:hypothetical protein BDF14DRAFT_1784077 [Spinellus fusiger]
MGATKSRKTRQNTSRPTALSFLSAISLGNEHEAHAVTRPPSLSYSHPAVNKETPPRDAIPVPNKDTLLSSLHTYNMRDNSPTYENRRAFHSLAVDTHYTTDTASLLAPVSSTLQPSSSLSVLERKKKSQTHRHDSNPTALQKHNSDFQKDVQHHKLTREDSKRPIASEKIKKKSNHNSDKVSSSNKTVDLFLMLLLLLF